MKKWELALLLGLILAIVLSQFVTFAETCADVRTDTLRLHVLANSDSEEDQTLKLAVRDAVLQRFGALFSSARSETQAARIASAHLDEVQQTAEQTVQEAGYSYPVAVRVERAWFATKEYEGFTLPAGEYDALRIEIGTAQGHNWFCVMYPPLCLPAAGDENGLAVYSPQEQSAVGSPYTIKFAALEWLERQKAKNDGQKSGNDGQKAAQPASAAQSGTASQESSSAQSGASQASDPEKSQSTQANAAKAAASGTSKKASAG